MIIPAIKNRRAVRQFKNNSVSDALIEEVIKAGDFAPTARGTRAVEYVVIKNLSLKKEINSIFPQESRQEFIETAPVLIVPVVDTKKSILPVQDLSVASENIFLQATELGLGSVWKNVNKKFEKDLIKLLKLSDSYTLINIIPIGYPAGTQTPHGEKDFNKNKIIAR